MGRVVGDSCRECGEKWQQKPPCFHLESKKFFIVKDKLGGGLGVGSSCPFVADISQVRTWCDKRNAIPSPASEDATNLLKYLRTLGKSQLDIRLSQTVRDSVDNRSSIVFNKEMRAYVPLYRGADGASLLRTVKGLVGRGPLSPAQVAIIQQSSKKPVALPTSAKAPKVQKVSGNFVHHSALTVDNCGVDWGGLAQAGNLWQATREGGYSDNLKRVHMLAGGLGRIEEAARAGFSEKYLRPALKDKLPNDATGVELALAIGKGVAWQIGLMAGAAALGVVGGAAIGTFFLPGLGTAAGAAAGASMATLMLNYVLTANDLKDTGQQLAEESKNIKGACELAVQKKMDEAKKAFAAVAAAILCVILIAIVAKFVQKGWAGIQKIRAKHKVPAEAYVNAHADHKGPTAVPVHGKKPAPAKQGTKVHGRQGPLGYVSEHLLTPVKSAKDVKLRDSEFQMGLETGKHNCLVLRVGDQERLDHLASIKHVRGKERWLGQKSSSGKDIDTKLGLKNLFTGMLGFSKENLGSLPPIAKSKHGKPLSFNMAMLGDKYKHMGQKKVYEMPNRNLKGTNPKDPTDSITLFDHDLYKQHREKCYLVDLGQDQYLIVDSLGQPFIQDVDVALIQARKQNGDGWLPLGTDAKGNQRSGPDNLINEDAMNNRAKALEWEKGNASTYNMVLHGGNGASPMYLDPKTGRVKWSPLKKDGTWQQEELVIFLPTGNGSRAFKFPGWKELGAFCDANGLAFPYDKPATKKIYD